MTGYYEQRAVLRDNETECEIEVRGGMEADDGSDAYDVTIRWNAHDPREVRMRVPSAEWRAFVLAVRRMR